MSTETPLPGDGGVLLCPECNGSDWIQVKTQSSIPECKNCHYSPAYSTPGNCNFEDWFKKIEEEWDQVQAALLEPMGEGILAIAAKRRAERALGRSRRRWEIAQALKSLLETDLREGVITIHVPDLGMLEQFKIGNYSLLDGLTKEKVS